MKGLIDRERAIEAISDIVSTVSVCAASDEARGMVRMKKEAIEALREEETVEAIPVKWIEEYATCLEKPVDVYLAEKVLLTAMIKKWRKERT